MSERAMPPVTPIVEQELGTLEVADQVFCDIAARTLSQVKGVAVVGRAGGSLFRRGSSARVGVERGLGEVAFSVHLTVRYNVSIPDLMREVHERLGRAVEEATGYRVRNVKVAIDHILPPVPKPSAPAAGGSENVPDLPPVPDRE